MAEQKVLIIGAGLAGLTLAHILNRHQVPFELFERDVKGSTRKQGWAVALMESIPVLEQNLPQSLASNLYKNSVNYALGGHDELGFVDLVSGEKVGAVGPAARGEPGHFLRICRKDFRDFLIDDHHLPVSEGKHFTHYKVNDASVTAFFDDGTSATGTLLVGSDGASSHTLNQLIGSHNHKPELSQYVPIFAEVDLPPEQYEPIRRLGTALMLGGAPGVRMQVGLMRMSKDLSSAHYFWALMPKRESPKELSDWIQGRTQQELFDFCLELAKDFSPVITNLIRFGGPEAIIKPAPKFVEYVPPPDFPRGRVTVMGDAGHTMIPFRGAGANTAVLDACDLGPLLVKAKEAGQDYSTVVDDYLQIMIPRGRDNVLSSRAAGVDKGDPAREWQALFKR